MPPEKFDAAVRALSETPGAKLVCQQSVGQRIAAHQGPQRLNRGQWETILPVDASGDFELRVRPRVRGEVIDLNLEIHSTLGAAGGDQDRDRDKFRRLSSRRKVASGSGLMLFETEPLVSGRRLVAAVRVERTDTAADPDETWILYEEMSRSAARAEQRGDTAAAFHGYGQALQVLEGLASRDPDWKPRTVDSHRDQTEGRIERLRTASN